MSDDPTPSASAKYGFMYRHPSGVVWHESLGDDWEKVCLVPPSDIDRQAAENDRLTTELDSASHELADISYQRTQWKEGCEAAVKENERLREALKQIASREYEANATLYWSEVSDIARSALSAAQTPAPAGNSDGGGT